jgi:predicted Fe-Mo cluster-binding NifX family protein
MKIAIPTNGQKGLEEFVAEHFGRCQTYTILNETGHLLAIINNTSSHMGGKGLPPELLKENHINILLCRGIGSKALLLCKKFSIDTYVVPGSTVKELYHKWKSESSLKATLNDTCKEHRS